MELAPTYTVREMARFLRVDRSTASKTLKDMGIDVRAAYRLKKPLDGMSREDILARLEHCSAHDLAIELGITYGAIWAKLDRTGGCSIRKKTKTHHPRFKLQVIPDNTIRTMLEVHLVKDIARSLGVSRRTLSQRISSMGLPPQIKRGKESPYWTGTSEERQVAYRTEEYRAWRKAVFERDDYTCQICSVRSENIIADHRKSWRNYPDLRYDVDNGRTLCRECHKNTPNYGGRAVRNKGL